MSNEKSSKKKGFISRVVSELKKVTWPTKKEGWKYFYAVVVICLLVSLFMGGLDAILTFIVKSAYELFN